MRAASSPVGPRPELLGPLRSPVYRRLFAAQVTSLVGTGLTTVALSLLAYDLAGGGAGSVLGIALALKMVAYVGVAPVAAAYTRRIDPKRLMVGLDLARAATIAVMPFVSAVWQVYALIFVVSACSAVFTPAFQALIPVVLPDEDDYTQALSLSRVAYELENLLSPALAAVLVGLVSYHALFAGDALTFLVSAALVATTSLPARRAAVDAPSRTWTTISRGVRRYLRVPELRALLALDLAVACASAMVIVNTVVFVRGTLGRGDADVGIALVAAGAGSLIAALAVPRLLRRRTDRTVLLAGGALLPLGLVAAAVASSWLALLATWAVIGVGLSLVQTPSGRLVQRSVRGDDGPELFAAQFALSHACWLVAYPVAGVLGEHAGLPATALTLALAAGSATIIAAWIWRRQPTRRAR